jgi:chemotaxis methyl-accepting protein methylase
VLPRANDTPLHITEVGPSTGEETWSLAAALAAQGLSYFIHAYEANRSLLRVARGATYEEDHAGLNFACRNKGYSPDCTRYFDAVGWHRFLIQPSVALRANARFYHHNALVDGLPPNNSDIVIANNVLYHYGPDERDQFFGEMVAAGRDGAVILFENAKSIEDWTAELPDRFPVEPIEAAGIWKPSMLRVHK